MKTNLFFVAIFVTSVTITCVTAFTVTPRLAPLHRTDNAIDGSYIVVLEDNYGAESYIKEMATKNTTKYFDTMSIKWVYTKALNGFSAKLSPAALAEIRSFKAVKYVVEDGTVKTNWVKPGTNLTKGNVQHSTASWGLDRINQRNLPLNGGDHHVGTGAGVSVYVVDTGIYPESMFYNGRASVGYDAVGGNGIDCQGHGTHCAGTVGADVYGVARDVQLLGVRVFGCSGGGTWSDFAEGCDYIANNAVKPAVASMSLSGGANTAGDDAVRNLIAAGIPVVVAAGNDDTNACYSSPARVSEAITVGATQSDDARSSFSNYGSCVDIFAPGTEIPSVYIGSPEATRTLSGTSMACPHVAGAVALLLEEDPTMSPAAVKAAIQKAATQDVLTNLPSDTVNSLLFVRTH